MQNIPHALKTLGDRVYLTRKCRINSAERLKNWDTIISLINTYYTAFLIVLSVVAISTPQSKSLNINLFLISSSVLAFAFNTLSMTLQFKDRYYNFKENYIKLNSLYLDIVSYQERVEGDDLYEEKLSQFQAQYNELLNACENHTSLDYYNVLKNDQNLYRQKVKSSKDNGEVTQASLDERLFKFRYYIAKIIHFIYIILMISAPFYIPAIIRLLSISINTYSLI